MGRLGAFGLLAAFAALGCASGPAPRDHFYRVEAGEPQRLASPRLTGTLEIDRLRAEAISQGRRIHYRETGRPGEIKHHAYHHWSDPPNVMLQDQLVAYLRAAGVAENVVTPAVHVDSDYRLSGRLVRFERILGAGESRVAVEVEIVLTRNEDRKLLLVASYREERAASGSGVAEAVTAYGEAATAIFERLLADLPSS